MAQDEGRFGRISRPKRCWAPPGIRPHAPSHVVRESVSVAGCCCSFARPDDLIGLACCAYDDAESLPESGEPNLGGLLHRDAGRVMRAGIDPMSYTFRPPFA